MRTTVNTINTEELPQLLDPDTEHTLILPTRNLVLFPGIHIPIQLGRESSVQLAELKYVQYPDQEVEAILQY